MQVTVSSSSATPQSSEAGGSQSQKPAATVKHHTPDWLQASLDRFKADTQAAQARSRVHADDYAAHHENWEAARA